MLEIQHKVDCPSTPSNMLLLASGKIRGHNGGMSAGERLRRVRRERGLTLEQLAELANTSNQQLSKLERGSARMTLDWVVRLARALDVDPSDLSDSEPMTAMPMARATAAGVPTGLSAFASPRPSDRSLPVLGHAEGGAGKLQLPVDERPVDWTFRPPQLEHVPTAYAIIITGQSMEPAYDEGDTLWIHPGLPVPAGHDALIVMNDDAALVKRVVRKTDTHLVVRQFGDSPRELPPIPLRDIRSIHRVVGAWNR